MSGKNIIFVLSIILLFFLWSSTYTAIILALDDFSAEGLALFRLLVASSLLFALSFRYKVRLPDKEDIPAIVVCGIFGICVYNLILLNGQKTMPVALCSLLLNTYPIFVAIFSFLLFKEFINPIKWIGIMVCFAGMIIASGETESGFLVNGSVILFVIAAIIQSMYDLKQKDLMKKYTPFELTCYFMWVGAAALLVYAPALLKDLHTVKASSLVPAVYLGAFPGVVSALLWAKLILKYSVSTMSCCCYVSPIFAALLAFIALGQIPSISTLEGIPVVISGLLLIHYSSKIRLRRHIVYLKHGRMPILSDLYIPRVRLYFQPPIQSLIPRFLQLFPREK
ncbi:MAG: EamA family transporter [Candidatus Gastranaerophilales bacterium]|nr:EamA family transporter [Candidatus Gastranaerophilales bacterium]